MKNLYTRFADTTNPMSLSTAMRKIRFLKFLELLKVTPNNNILDVGGMESIWLGTGYENNVTLLNISVDKKTTMKHIVADACNMSMIGDKEYDIVFSNSVIEHVGCEERQKKFASEILRVGNKYWIQTPNKRFPIEPHFLFPLLQYLPKYLQKPISLKWRFSPYYLGGVSKEEIIRELETIHLLTKDKLQHFFPGAVIFEEKYYGLTKSFAAYSC